MSVLCSYFSSFTLQLRVIYMHMELTKKNIEELMEKFGNDQPPPAIFLEVRPSNFDQAKLLINKAY